MAHYLVCYDIANPKRLGKVRRRAVHYATFVQYSVYYLDGEREDLERMLCEIAEVIDVSQDDVRAYCVTPLTLAIQKGKSWLPEGIYLP